MRLFADKVFALVTIASSLMFSLAMASDKNLADDVNASQAETKSQAKVSSKKTVTNSVGIKMALIPAGEFMMGSSKSPEEIVKLFGSFATYYKDEHPQHKVRISKPFYMATTEITQGQWKTVMATTPWKGKDEVKEGDDYPATYISWNDAQKFIAKLNQKQKGTSYRLPTEAEWEYACRAGSKSLFSFGDSVANLKDHAWSEENAEDEGEEYAHQVALKRPNKFGLFDMHGNVWEWCSDWHRGEYYQQFTDRVAVDPQGPQDSGRKVLRGGAWNFNAGTTRSANRFDLTPGNQDSDTGFRVVRSVSR